MAYAALQWGLRGPLHARRGGRVCSSFFARRWRLCLCGRHCRSLTGVTARRWDVSPPARPSSGAAAERAQGLFCCGRRSKPHWPVHGLRGTPPRRKGPSTACAARNDCGRRERSLVQACWHHLVACARRGLAPTCLGHPSCKCHVGGGGLRMRRTARLTVPPLRHLGTSMPDRVQAARRASCPVTVVLGEPAASAAPSAVWHAWSVLSPCAVVALVAGCFDASLNAAPAWQR